MPIQYALIGFGLSALVGAVLSIVFKSEYDSLAELAELFTADKAQAIANHFSNLAQELRKPGK